MSCNLIIGGSSGVGLSIAKLLAAKGEEIIIVSRDIRDLEVIQRDFLVRFNANINILAVDISKSDFNLEYFVDKCLKLNDQINRLYICVGAIDPLDDGLPENDLIYNLNIINFVRPAQILTSFLRRLEKDTRFDALVFSSIATSAPRRRNASYAAAKCSLQSYCLSLQHQFAANDWVNIHLCSLGYVDTSMSFNKKLLFPVAKSKKVAKFAIKIIDNNMRFTYYPRFWIFVVFILKKLPWIIYKKIDF